MAYSKEYYQKHREQYLAAQKKIHCKEEQKKMKISYQRKESI